MTSIMYGEDSSSFTLPSMAVLRVASMDSVASIYPFSRVSTTTIFSEQLVGSEEEA
jgi:hypothetical protein